MNPWQKEQSPVPEVIARILDEAKQLAAENSASGGQAPAVSAPYRDPNGTPEMGMTRASTPQSQAGGQRLADTKILSAIEADGGDNTSILP